MSIIGQNIHRLRRERSLSQAKLAKSARVSQGLIAGLENESIVTTKKISQIASALGVSVFEIDPELAGSSQAANHLDDNTPNVPVWIGASGELPLYTGRRVLGDSIKRGIAPIRTIERIESLRRSKDAYAIMVSDIYMSPELEPGDIIYADPDLPPIPNSTCILHKSSDLMSYHVCRLEKFDADAWSIITWRGGVAAKAELKASDWPICHRIVAKLYRV